MTTERDELLLTSEVAELLRVPEGTLRYWRATGRNSKGEALGPDSFTVGNGVRYRRSAVVAWLAEQEATTSAHGRSA